jgi:hypothetical protein
MSYGLNSLDGNPSKSAIPLASALIVFLLAGCGTTPQLVVLPTVGPDTVASPQTQSSGVLQVYSARAPADTDMNFDEFFANDDFGGNSFPVEPAHTDYTIYTQAGQVFQRVHNARNLDDPQPSLVTLPGGTYRIEAQMKDANPGTVPVVVPVIIEAGRVTQVHLDGNYRTHARPAMLPVSTDSSKTP